MMANDDDDWHDRLPKLTLMRCSSTRRLEAAHPFHLDSQYSLMLMLNWSCASGDSNQRDSVRWFSTIQWASDGGEFMSRMPMTSMGKSEARQGLPECICLFRREHHLEWPSNGTWSQMRWKFLGGIVSGSRLSLGQSQSSFGHDLREMIDRLWQIDGRQALFAQASLRHN